jgi:diguanylate cyclase (GGDEF)-like protein
VHYRQLQANCEQSGQDTSIASLENRTRVLSDRVARFVTLKCGKLVNQVRQAADIDALTLFYSRGYLDRRLAKEVKDSRVPFCVAFADVDHFGEINKQFGWPTGDKVLREVGDLIRTHLREHDWVGRYGGEEFCIVMQNTTLTDSFPILERLRQAVESYEFRSTKGSPLAVTMSVGAVESTSNEDHEQLVERASARALDAKQGGRNRVLI